MIERCLRHRAPVLWLLLPFMGGLIAGKTIAWSWPVGWLLGGAAVAACVAIANSRRLLLWTGALGIAVFLCGAASYEFRRARLAEWETLPPREARVTLRIERTFAPSADTKRISGIGTITLAEPHLRSLQGQRLYFALDQKPGGARPGRSAEIAVTGLLEPLPREAPLASFDGFLTAAGLNFRLTRGHVRAVTGEADAYSRFCDETQLKFGDILSRGLAHQPELAGALRAMMLGQKHELTEMQQSQFLQSGTMHLFAISGLHIAVIAVALHGLLGVLRLPRPAQFAAGLIALWLYVEITGGSPSAVRAFLMIALAQIALATRLAVNPVATLSLAALLCLLLDPMQLFSASFLMSYGIVASIILLGLPLGERWSARMALFRDLPRATWSWHHHARDRAWRWVLSALALGCATTVVSTICGVVFFQLFTPGGLLANLVLIPVSSLVILGGFTSLLCGLLGLGALCTLFNHAAALVLAFMETSIAWMLKLPGFFWQAEFTAVWAGFVVLGAVLVSLFTGYALRWELRWGGFWAPFALTVLALVLVTRFA